MLLTIAIPTYNRRIHLQRLLDAMRDMVAGLEGRVEVIVSDNASTDGTPDIVAAFVAECPLARSLRNETNLGSDGNIARCFLEAQGSHVWIIGDDDIPKSGVLPALLQLLTDKAPDLVYLPSEWMPDVTDPGQGRSFDPNRYRSVDRIAFARYVNIWMTFVSGIVVRKSHASSRSDLMSLDKTSLIQLGWVLPALKAGSKFYIFGTEAVLATAGNTGGYAAVRVFGSVFPHLTAQELGRQSPEYKAMVGRTVSGYLPHLIWSIRTGTAGQFDVDMPWSTLRKEIGGFAAFWLFALPVGQAPASIGKAVLSLSKLLSRVNRVVDRRLRYRL